MTIPSEHRATRPSGSTAARRDETITIRPAAGRRLRRATSISGVRSRSRTQNSRQARILLEHCSLGISLAVRTHSPGPEIPRQNPTKPLRRRTPPLRGLTIAPRTPILYFGRATRAPSEPPSPFGRGARALERRSRLLRAGASSTPTRRAPTPRRRLEHSGDPPDVSAVPLLVPWRRQVHFGDRRRLSGPRTIVAAIASDVSGVASAFRSVRRRSSEHRRRLSGAGRYNRATRLCLPLTERDRDRSPIAFLKSPEAPSDRPTTASDFTGALGQSTETSGQSTKTSGQSPETFGKFAEAFGAPTLSSWPAHSTCRPCRRTLRAGAREVR